MSMRGISFLTCVLTVVLVTSCSREPAWTGSLEALLRSQPKRFHTVMQDPERYRLQIIYTQIDRDEQNRPSFQTFRYRVDAREYFYPASTVKLLTAMLALEKINNLNLSRDLTMLTGAAAGLQTAVTSDPSAPNGLPSVGHYVRKILRVSDNDAYNRLYEFLGQQELNESLRRKGFSNTRIVHRLELTLDPEQNQWTNPVRFMDGEVTLYEQDAVYGDASFLGMEPTLLGVAEIIDGKRVEGPKDFSVKNAYPLQDMHDLVLGLIFPDTVDEDKRFNLTDDDYQFLYREMSGYPAESGIPAYADRETYPDGYAKFLMYGGSAQHIPDNIRIFNKIGDAYGFLTDCAYVVDFDAGIEFLLAATIYTNENQTFNDGEYEYDEIGFPFLRNLGQAIYEVELNRERTNLPDLGRFRFDYR